MSEKTERTEKAEGTEKIEKTENIEKSGKTEMTGKNDILSGIPGAVLHFFTYRWEWKLLSVLISVVIWGMIVTGDSSLMRTRNFNNVKVSVTNAATLKTNGYIVVGGLEALPQVNIRVSLPQANYNAATADRYTVRADLSSIRGTGTQTVQLTATSMNASTYGQVVDISPSSITVQVEEYTARTRIPVRLAIIGDAPEGLYAASAVTDPSTVDIAGPKSVVNGITRCVVEYDMSALTPDSGETRTACSFYFQDRTGAKVDTSYLTVTSQSVTLKHINVTQTLYETCVVPVSVKSLTYGKPAEGYEAVSVKVEPEYITVAADDLTVFKKDGAVMTLSGRVNLNGETDTKTEILTVNKRGAVYLSDETVLVTVEIAPAGRE